MNKMIKNQAVFSERKLNQLIENRIVRFNEVVKITGLSKSTIRRRMEKNKFPKCFNISERSIGWYESDINEWLKGLKPSDT